MLIDTHAHLDFERFDEDREEVLARASAAGVRRVVTIGTRLDSSRRAIALAERYPGLLRASVGFHPLYMGDDTEEGWAALEALARHPLVCALGETGLDYYYDAGEGESAGAGAGAEGGIEALRARQRASFARHLALSAALGKPVVVHIRDSFDDALRLTAEANGGRGLTAAGGVVHCFTGGPEECARALELGYHISLSGVVTFKSAKALRAAVPCIPLDRLLVETDAPFLAPAPHRGARNEPAFVRHTAEEVARLLGLPLEEVARATTANAERLFGLAAPPAPPSPPSPRRAPPRPAEERP